MPARHNLHILHIQTSRWDADLANEWWGCSLWGDYSALTTASQLSLLPKHISSRRQARGRLREADLGLVGVILCEGGRGGWGFRSIRVLAQLSFLMGSGPSVTFLLRLHQYDSVLTGRLLHTCVHTHKHACTNIHTDKHESPMTVTLCHTSYMTYWPTLTVC